MTSTEATVCSCATGVTPCCDTVKPSSSSGLADRRIPSSRRASAHSRAAAFRRDSAAGSTTVPVRKMKANSCMGRFLAAAGAPLMMSAPNRIRRTRVRGARDILTFSLKARPSESPSLHTYAYFGRSGAKTAEALGGKDSNSGASDLEERAHLPSMGPSYRQSLPAVKANLPPPARKEHFLDHFDVDDRGPVDAHEALPVQPDLQRGQRLSRHVHVLGGV